MTFVHPASSRERWYSFLHMAVGWSGAACEQCSVLARRRWVGADVQCSDEDGPNHERGCTSPDRRRRPCPHQAAGRRR